jgi:hypothetical protein
MVFDLAVAYFGQKKMLPLTRTEGVTNIDLKLYSHAVGLESTDEVVGCCLPFLEGSYDSIMIAIDL